MGGAVLFVREVTDVPYRVDGGGSGGPDADVVDDLAGEIALLSAHIDAASQRLLSLIARFDELRGWELSGHRDCAHWLSWRTGIDAGAARERVRVARALAGLPLTRAAMGRGELSFSKARALSRVATPKNEADLLPLARGATAAQLERMVRAWKRGNRQDETALERERHESRTFSVFPDDDGMYAVRGRLTPEVGALLMRAIEAASDALFSETAVPGTPEDSARDAAQRRADAIGLLAERALNVGFGDSEQNAEAPLSGCRAQRYQVVLHVESATLLEEGDPGRSDLEDGTRVSAETSRRVACDCSLVEVTHGQDGAVLNVGRRTRTIPPALRRALEVRDRGCRFPGCGLRFTDGHHVRHWADGGETSLDNCLLLCRYHHRLVHEGVWKIGWAADRQPLFFGPRGVLAYDGRWRDPELPEDVAAALAQENEAAGAKPDEWTATVRWERAGQIPEEVVMRAWGASSGQPPLKGAR